MGQDCCDAEASNNLSARSHGPDTELGLDAVHRSHIRWRNRKPQKADQVLEIESKTIKRPKLMSFRLIPKSSAFCIEFNFINRITMIWRFALTIAISWFGTILPILMLGMIKNLSWALRLVVPNWIVNGSLAVVLILWIAVVLIAIQRIWSSKKSKVTRSREDQRLAKPRPFPIKPRSIMTPMARINIPLKFDKPPNDADAQQ